MSLVKTTKGEKSSYTIEFSIKREAFDAAVTEAFNEKNKNITIPGFRKGKAPRSFVEKMYGKGFCYDEALNKVCGPAYEEALKKSKLEAVSRPEIDVVKLEETGDVILSAKFDVKPEEVKIENYFGIKASKKVAKTTKEEVEEQLNTLRERNSREVEINDDTAAVMNDVATIDYEGSVDGVPFEGGKGDAYPLKLGSGNFIPGFEDQIVGHKIGETFDVNVTFPTEYHAKELAGKAAVFKTTIKALTHVELPALDDEFAKDASEFDTIDALKADIKEKITKRHTEEAERAFEDAILDQLIEKVEAEIPESMFDNEAENFVRDYDFRLRSQGLDLQTYFKYTGLDLDKLRAQMRPQAEKQVKLRLALETIAKLEKLEATKEEVDAEIKRIADENQMKEKEVLNYVTKEAVATDLVVKKAMDLVKEKAIVD